MRIAVLLLVAACWRSQSPPPAPPSNVAPANTAPASGDRDTDADGIVDAEDLCPEVAEDKDGFEDEDGCLEPDNDRDTIADFDDACPNDQETWNGRDDTDGCPDRSFSPVAP